MTRRRVTVCLALLLVLLAMLHLGHPAADAADAVPAYEMDKVAPFEFHGDVRDLRSVESAAPPRPSTVRPLRTRPRTGEPKVPLAGPDVAPITVPLAPMPSPIQNFAGLSFLDSCTGGQCGAGWPPDTNGDVGSNHYIQAVNSAYAIYSKTGTLLAAFTEDQLWSTGGSNPCNGNSFGDPVVLYDQLADRWILTHFAFAVDGAGNPVSPFYQCIAASKTSDPVSGGWWLYPLRMDPGGTGKPPVGALNDYPKFGIWPDCLYMGANEFSSSGAFIGTAFASFSRTDLYSGGPLTWSLGFINNATDPFTMIPSNLLGMSSAAWPAPGTPNYFVSESQTAFAFEVRKFTAGPNCGSGGTLSAPTNVSQTSYVVPAGDIVPQPGTARKLDSIDDRLMQKVQYRKVGTAESLWVVHNVSTSPVRLQWAQLDVTGGVIGAMPVQQQIYAPDSALYRWMGSLAVDKQGNMALGYSTSSGSAFPGIAYSGRLASDPLNTLPQSEVQLIAGTGSQTNTDRWGDYSAMSVDPADDCTFWYTNEYYTASGSNWHTRIGSFKFPSCTATTPTATTNAASGLTPSSATLNGTVNPNGLATTASFQWGTTTAYGNTTPSQSLGTGMTAVGVAGTLTGLAANTAYHYRVMATNSAGTTAGSDVTFMTLAKASTTTTVVSSANPAVTGQLVTFTATVSAASGTPTGVVTFFDGASALGAVTLKAAGQAALITGALSVGSHSITVQYAGDPNFTASTSAALTQAISTFTDVPVSHPFFTWVEALFAAGITGGCGGTPPLYCPDGQVTRDQMAVFLLKAKHGPGFVPPPATGMFADVPIGNLYAPWIEQLAREGITGGCGPTTYCPGDPVTRAQMAVLLLKAEHGGGYGPPAATGMFTDVPVGNLYAPWIEQLAREGITHGCGPTTYCPGDPVTRAQMAVFLVLTFGLPH